MIYAHMQGALGMQMFKYAFCRRLSLDNNDEPICIDAMTGWADAAYGCYRDFMPDIVKAVKTFGPWMRATDVDLLKDFVLFPNVKFVKRNLGYFIGTLPCTFKRLSFAGKCKKEGYTYPHTKEARMDITKGFYVYPDCFEYDYASNAKRRHVMNGCYSERYFYPYREQIQQELKVKTPPSEANARIIDEIQRCNAVMVHFRLTGTWVAGTDNYYKRAMRYIAEAVENPIFYIFSDKIDHIRENIQFDYPIRYVEANKSDIETMVKTAYEELRLMYSCKHSILAASAFSWWGGYLNENPNKIVCMPDPWGTPGTLPRENLVYFEGATRIDSN
jgi:hypothetical protein